MSEEEEYNADEQFDDDEDIIGEFLIDEVSDDLTLLMFPQVKYDFEAEFETYYKILKKCRTKDQMKTVLSGIISHTSAFAIIEHEIKFLQDRAKDLEFNISMMQET